MNLAAATEQTRKTAVASATPWKLLIVDDEPAVQRVTQMVLADFDFQGRPVRILEAQSAAEAKILLAAHPDIALALIDVVMESNDAGLNLIRSIREEMGNRLMRIVVRTGQPGYAPEARVIHDFDISDYKEKTELTALKLRTTVAASLRSYDELHMLAAGHAQLHATALAAREDAERAGQAQIEFLSNLSHELFTPLNVILGYAQLLQHTVGDERQSAQLGSIVAASRNLLELLDGLLRLAGEARNGDPLALRTVGLRALVNEAATLRAGDALDASVQIRNEVPEEVQVLAEPVSAREILVNLLSNAVRASPAGTTVRVHAAPQGTRMWRLHVSDAGPGIAPETRAHLFDLFSQITPKKAPTAGAAGLGLPLSRQIARRMGMQLDIEPHSGKGTTFYLDMTRADTGSPVSPLPESH